MGKITKSKILDQLSPMYNVALTEGDNGQVFIEKDGIKFGFLENKDVYFIDEKGSFLKLDAEVTENPDSLLFEATKSFWCARSLKKVLEREA